ncbi:uncharacterized protein TM35_000033350 [Trypanosoma theileri]|uniref:Uncharacterized protein n=1 Tax=Trypanosoma theileri TaxID=67003 RepID=A0A1X0P6N1_9TRYP|nr:uncharacterized protein TM35_000033350 [Trypanosoma theileri]ORC92582.1 hypothetical protein TM35_000033350 [Trypanosoma theileri]
MELEATTTATMEESVDRFQMVRDRLFDVDYTWYTMRAEENHLLYGSSLTRRPIDRYKPPERKFFKCFYDSFRERDDKYHLSLLYDVIAKESLERATLRSYESEEFSSIARHAGEVMRVPQWCRFYFNKLPVIEAEEMERRMIKSEFYSMYLEAVTVLEILHRRVILFTEEPAARNSIVAAETHDWIECRRQQVERERQEELEENARERKRLLLYHDWKKKQEYQIFLFEQSEQEERMDVERLQRLHIGTWAQLFHAELKEARYHQLKYQLRQRLLNAECSRNIMAEEATERSSIMLLQKDQFRTLEAEEVKSFLWTRRHMMVNEAVEGERCGNLTKTVM